MMSFSSLRSTQLTFLMVPLVPEFWTLPQLWDQPTNVSSDEDVNDHRFLSWLFEELTGGEEFIRPGYRLW